MPLQVDLVIIDPQNSFMGDDNGDPYSVQTSDGKVLKATLPVKGAVSDMKRLATMVDRVGGRLNQIHVTLCSHHPIDCSHPGMWRDQNGDPPPPYTIIKPADMDNNIWYPRYPDMKPEKLDGLTLRQYFRKYLQTLYDQGNYPHCIWPEHCLIGTWGHNIQPDLADALERWERKKFSNVHYVVKGDDAFTEHFGALQAEVPNPKARGTVMNGDFLDVLRESDIVAVAGEASSHCVLETVKQIANNIGIDHIKKFHLLGDCMSPVIHPQYDFPGITKAFFAEKEKQGMTMTTSDRFLT